MPDRTIGGRYDVRSELGRGGMGAVWLCHDRVLGRLVALKQIGGLPGESSPHLARALREARTTAALTHPNVVSIYDALEEGDHVWLVMEHVPSRTLEELVREDGPLAPRRTARIGAQIADGLAAAHAGGMIHRDVKPSNVLVGDGDAAKISDFGIARRLGDETLTQTGMVIGTPMYFSPQLARGAAPTPADDVWALGATLYAAVEGAPPWPRQDNSIATLVHIAEHPAPRPQRAGPLAPVISRMMASEPDDRLTMADVARRLHALSDGTVPDVLSEEGTVVMSAPVPAATPPGGPAAEGERTPTVETAAAPPPATEERPRRRLVPLVAALVVLALLVGGGALAIGLLGGDDGTTPVTDEPSSRAPATRGTERETASEPTTAPTTSEESPTSEPTSEPTETTSEAPPPSTDAAQFVTDYYALLPTNTQEAWSLLSDQMQAEVGGYGSYRGFWRTIDAVSVDAATEDSPGTVEIDLTYTSDAGTESETRLITVEEAGDGLLIVGDQVA